MNTNNNDVLRSMRYALDLPDAAIADMVKLAGGELAVADITGLLKKEDEADFIPCDDELLMKFLDGLIIKKRGPSDKPAVPAQLSNNLILKKLRIAFELKEDDMHDIIELGGFELSKPELSALFRSTDNKNYRHCGDQLLRYFLRGLSLRLRG
ncbi:MAG: DUF1456 family protein [Sulfuriferula sp.]